MKKTISLILALILALSACAVSFADDPDEIPGTVEMPLAGLRFVPPEAFRDTKGRVITEGAIEIAQGIYYAYWLYCAMTEEELNAVYNSGHGDNRIGLLFYVFSINDNQSFDDLNEILGESRLPKESVREIGKAGKATFYLYSEGANSDFAELIGDAYRDEYIALAGMADEAAAAFTCYEPLDRYASLAGQKIEFTTKDLKGNAVSSADLFAQNEITLVNIWATWCGPCVGELAELQKLHDRLQAKNCGVVGLLDDNDLKSARQLVAGNGVAYPIIRAPGNLYDIFPITAYPSTFFVSRDGRILGSPVVGAYPDQYEETLNSLLGQK